MTLTTATTLKKDTSKSNERSPTYALAEPLQQSAHRSIGRKMRRFRSGTAYSTLDESFIEYFQWLVSSA